ncbi:MAG TPA: hypothetical protein VHG93_02810, partial [Longimicrobium sp.]|nr:hypothetical protein [Longimicrobium sp.]
SARGVARARDADLREDAQAAAMNAALWPATWGHFLWQMMSGVLSFAEMDHGRAHFERHVRAAGPLPALRVGRQPYGVLPVLALDRWTAQDEPDATRAARDGALVGFLRQVRDRVFLPSTTSARLPRVDAPDADPRARLLQILGQSAVSAEHRARGALGVDYVTHLWRFLQLRLTEGWQEEHAEEPRAVLERLGLTGLLARREPHWDPRVTRAVYSRLAMPLGGPRVQAANATGEATAAAYLGKLASVETGWDELMSQAPPGGRNPAPLLYLLARQAAIAEHARAAAELLALGADVDLEPELIDIRPGPETQTLVRYMAQRPGGGATVAERLKSAPPPRIAALRARLAELADVPVPVLERMTAEALDLASHRLDAWITGFATRRLRWLREQRPTGVHLGAYGMLVDIRKRRPAVAVADPPPDEPGVVEQPGNAGYVHAPSLVQAATAAVLRSGWRSHTGGGPNALAVDLSSRRVRLAAWLLDGVRQGLPLGVLLGYRFERFLHERPEALEAYLPAFRRLAPVLGTGLRPGGPPVESVAATQVA